MSKKVCDCNCTEGNHDFVIERLYHMREEIDYIIKALEHKNFKEAANDLQRYNNNLLDISKDLHLKISIKEIPTILDKVDDTYFSSVEIDLSEFKDIDLIQ